MFISIEQVRNRNTAKGGKWFSPNNMAFFNTTIHGDLFAGRYFVTSDHPHGEKPLYSVRMVTDSADIETVCKVQDFATRIEAAEFIQALPPCFYEAWECARAEWKEGTKNGIGFAAHAMIEIDTRGYIERGEYDNTTFAGACTFICERYQNLDFNWCAAFINGNDELTNLNYKFNFQS